MVRSLSECSQCTGVAPQFHVRHDKLIHWVNVLTIIYFPTFVISFMNFYSRLFAFIVYVNTILNVRHCNHVQSIAITHVRLIYACRSAAVIATFMFENVLSVVHNEVRR